MSKPIDIFGMPSSSIFLLFSVVFTGTKAIPWPAPSKTASYVADEWTPRPTSTHADPKRLFKRDSPDVAICGWIGGYSAQPAGCASGSSCVHDTIHAYVGCCAISGPCNGVYTTCIDEGSSGWTPSSQLFDNGILSCASSSTCYQNLYPDGYTQLGCGSSNAQMSIATTFSGQASDVRLQIVYLGVTFNPTMTISTPQNLGLIAIPATLSFDPSTTSVSAASQGKGTTTSSSSASTSTHKNNIPAIIAGVSGGLAGLLIFAAIAFWCLRRRRNRVPRGPVLNHKSLSDYERSYTSSPIPYYQIRSTSRGSRPYISSPQPYEPEHPQIFPLAVPPSYHSPLSADAEEANKGEFLPAQTHTQPVEAPSEPYHEPPELLQAVHEDLPLISTSDSFSSNWQEALNSHHATILGPSTASTNSSSPYPTSPIPGFIHEEPTIPHTLTRKDPQTSFQRNFARTGRTSDIELRSEPFRAIPVSHLPQTSKPATTYLLSPSSTSSTSNPIYPSTSLHQSSSTSTNNSRLTPSPTHSMRSNASSNRTYINISSSNSRASRQSMRSPPRQFRTNSEQIRLLEEPMEDVMMDEIPMMYTPPGSSGKTRGDFASIRVARSPSALKRKPVASVQPPVEEGGGGWL